MPHDRCRQHQRQGECRRFFRAAARKIKMHRQYALSQIADKGQHAAPEAPVQKGIGGAGVFVLTFFYSTFFVKQGGKYIGKQNAAVIVIY